jgi:uncharacterized repeat protein (TIGR03803 family)
MKSLPAAIAAVTLVVAWPVMAQDFAYQSLVAINTSSTGSGLTMPFSRASDGRLYNAFSAGGGAFTYGAVFSLSATGTDFTSVFKVTGNDPVFPNGAYPFGGVVEGPDGRLYGSTKAGSANNYGNIFAVHKDGSGFVILKQCTLAGGNGPIGRLAIDANGTLYGVTEKGGANNLGTVFRMNRVNATTYIYSVIHDFAGGANSGSSPASGPMLASDGNLYGTTPFGGSFTGVVYKIVDPGNGAFFTIIKESPDLQGSGFRGTPIELPDGRLAGTARDKGSLSGGVVYAVDKDGTNATILHSFTNSGSGGSNPVSDLILASDGLIYGVTESGGTNLNDGTAFRMSTTGSDFLCFHLFTVAEGTTPLTGLTEISPGIFLGATSADGPSGAGAIYSLTSPNKVPVVKIKGKAFLRTNKAKVKIAGTATDDIGLLRVEYKIGKKGKYRPAKGTSKWTINAKLKPGLNVITIRAVDIRRTNSKPATARVIRLVGS